MTESKKNIGKSEKIGFYAKIIAKYTFTVGLSFILAMGRFTDNIAPLGVAFACSVDNSMLPVSAVGAVLGYFASFGTSVETLKYIASVIIGAIAVYAVRMFLHSKYKIISPPVAAFISLFLTGFTVTASTSMTFKGTLYFIAEGLIGSLSSYFIYVCLNLPDEKKYISRLNTFEICSLLVFISETVLSLNEITIWYFTLSRVLGTVIILLSAKYGKEKGGALTGICIGFVISLSEGMSFTAGAFALGGLLAGIFAHKNKFLAAIAFILTNGITAIPSTPWIDAINLMYDICLGCIIIMLFPSFADERLRIYFDTDTDILTGQGQKQIIKMRLLTASDSLMTVSKQVRSVLKIFDRRWEPAVRDCVSLVSETVCENCEKHSECVKNRQIYNDFIKDTALTAKNFGIFSKDSINYDFCIKPYDVFLTVNNEYNRYKNQTTVHSDMSKTSLIAADQFTTTAEYLQRMAQRLNRDEIYISDSSERLRKALEKEMNLDIITCGVFSVGGKICTEIYLNIMPKNDFILKLRKTTSVMLNKEMEIPVTDTLSDSTVIVKMCEKTAFTVNYGGFQIASDNETWCGDSYDCFQDGKGNLIMILSDGMGTGKRAAADSVMTRSLASSLIRSDFGCENVTGIVNSSMMLRASEESTSTLDIANINLYTGKVTFYKAGANYSYILKKDRLLKIEKPSMPLGILRNVKFEKIETTVKDGDIIIMMSDGVSENSKDIFKSILSNSDSESGENISKQLAKASFAFDKGKHHDDITVISGIITKNM